MCNLYRVRSSQDEVGRTFDADPIGLMEKDYAAPGGAGYVVREAEGRRVLETMRWGFPFQNKPLTNVRNYGSPFWRSALVNPARRCLVPFSSFQEWSVTADPSTGKKRAHWFSLPASPLAAFAGVWRPAEEGPYFSFLTCGYDGDPAAHVVGAIHPKVCLVVLHPEDYDRWLRADLDDVLTMATPFPSQLMSVSG